MRSEGLSVWGALEETGLERPSRHLAAAGIEKPNRVKVYPALATAMLRAGVETAGRVWLLARFLDGAGRGWIGVEAVREALTTKGGALRICGWRRLRMVLREGAGVFWERDDRGRIWLFSAEKAARNLGVARLEGHPVHVPIAELTKSIRIVRATLYATFHAGREAAPICRATLSKKTGLAARTQRVYDGLAGVARRSNVALGARLTADNRQEHFFRRDGAFVFVDKLGKVGEAGAAWLAWRLPNSYETSFERAPDGRRKKINCVLREDSDLVTTGVQGNGVEPRKRLFFDGLRGRMSDRTTDRYFRDAGSGLWITDRQGAEI